MRILASLKKVRAHLRGKLGFRQQSQDMANGTADQQGLSFSDHVEAIATEYEWLRAEKRKSRKTLPLSPTSGASELVPLTDYTNYVEDFVDWLDSIGEAREQTTDDIIALARMFEAWSGWGRARPSELFHALKWAGIKSRRINLKRGDPRYATAKQKKTAAKPHLVVYQLAVPSSAELTTKLAA